jgi:hypothetical protein
LQKKEGKWMEGSVNQEFITLLMFRNERLRFSPDVPPYQCFREGPAGKTARKRFKIKYVRSRYMYEKKQINDKLPAKNRTFMFKIRTFLSNRHEICRKSASNYDETTEFPITLTRAAPPHHNGLLP